jgi:nucleotide-binding universal stress UspA family protein
VYQRILVGTDGSATAARAVDRAVALARTTGATLTILSAGRPARARAVVDAEARRHESSGVAIRTAIADADPVSALIDAAGQGGYDLLVTGNRGMTGARRFLPIGSVPNKVSHHLPCSLLIVRTT